MKPRKRLLALGIGILLLLGACGEADPPGEEPADTADEPADMTDDPDDPEQATTADGEPIVIGVLEDRTGPGSFFSQQAVSVIRLSIEQVNEDGGVLGRPIELIFEDDQADPTLSASLVRRMIENGAVAILNQSGSASAIQAKPVLEEEQVPGLAPTNLSTDIINEPHADWSFIVPNPITDIATVYVDAYEAAGIETIAFAFDDDATLVGLTEDFMIPYFEERGIVVVAAEALPPDASDITAEISRLRDADPDGVFMASFGGPLEPMVYNTMQTLGWEVPRFSLASIGNMPDTWDLADDGALDGVVFSGSISAENELAQDLEALLREELDGFEHMTAFHAQAWDAIQLLVQAIEDAGVAEGPAIRDALENVAVDATFGQPGHTLNFTPDKHMATGGLCGIVLVQFEGNEPGDPWDVYQPSC